MKHNATIASSSQKTYKRILILIHTQFVPHTIFSLFTLLFYIIINYYIVPIYMYVQLTVLPAVFTRSHVYMNYSMHTCNVHVHTF